MGPPSSGITTHRRVQKGPIQCDLGGSRWAGAPVTQSLDGDSRHGDMECHLTGGKETELVQEVEWYRLGILRLTSTHSLGSGTQLLERGWTLFYSGVARGERWGAGVGLVISPAAMCWSSPW